MSRYTPSNSGSHAKGDRRSTASGPSALDYITMASGHSRVSTNMLHPGSASRRGAATTVSPYDSISCAPSRHAPSTYFSGQRSITGVSHSPSKAFHGGGGASHAGSRAEIHVPQSTIRSIASGAGSSYEASQALARHNASISGKSASGFGTMVSKAPSTSGGGSRYGVQNVKTPSGQTITVTETNVEGGTKTVVTFSK